MTIDEIKCYMIAYKKKNGQYSIHSTYYTYDEAKKKLDWLNCHRKREYELLAC